MTPSSRGSTRRKRRSRAFTDVIRYLTGATTPELDALAPSLSDIGLMIQPGNNYYNRVQHFSCFGGDNGAFTTKPGGFNAELFGLMISNPNLQAHRHRCLFIAAPDALKVFADGTVIGDPIKTLEQFPFWAAILRGISLPVALVAQDGLETMLDRVPWAKVDVLFLGGSTEWKLGNGARACVDEAKRQGKRTHMGRVNSYKRLALANAWGIDTADGTFLKFGPKKNLPRMLGWFEQLRKDFP